jgi:hypothetical protein
MAFSSGGHGRGKPSPCSASPPSSAAISFGLLPATAPALPTPPWPTSANTNGRRRPSAQRPKGNTCPARPSSSPPPPPAAAWPICPPRPSSTSKPAPRSPSRPTSPPATPSPSPPTYSPTPAGSPNSTAAMCPSPPATPTASSPCPCPPATTTCTSSGANPSPAGWPMGFRPWRCWW